MDRRIELSYKRICFHGRGIAARWLDRIFFSLLGGVCLYLIFGNLLLAGLLFLALLTALLLWDKKQWSRFESKLWDGTAKKLGREDWLKGEATRIHRMGGVILHPTPNEEAMMGYCLRFGQGTAFHCFGESKAGAIRQAESFGCTLAFHPWEEDRAVERERIVEQLRRDAPKQNRTLWRALLHLPGNRYLLTGCALLMLSVLLRKALYWRLLGSVCLLIGALRRSIHIVVDT